MSRRGHVTLFLDVLNCRVFLVASDQEGDIRGPEITASIHSGITKANVLEVVELFTAQGYHVTLHTLVGHPQFFVHKEQV